jgi:hypothetical protein
MTTMGQRTGGFGNEASSFILPRPRSNGNKEMERDDHVVYIIYDA